MRLYRVDGSIWCDDSEEAKNVARLAAAETKREIRAAVVWIKTDRASVLQWLNSGRPLVRRHSIIYIARPIQPAPHSP